jgi:hypothetical protein
MIRRRFIIKLTFQQEITLRDAMLSSSTMYALLRRFELGCEVKGVLNLSRFEYFKVDMRKIE